MLKPLFRLLFGRILGFHIGRIVGASMQPTIPPDSFIICNRFFMRLKTGQRFRINHPQYGIIVKTLSQIDGQSLYFCSEFEQGVSRQQIGKIDKSQLLDQVLWVIKPDHKS